MGAIWRKGVTEEDFVLGKHFGMMVEGRRAVVQIMGISDDHLVMMICSGGFEGKTFEVTKEWMRFRGDVQILQV